ncbi:Acetyl-CoA carboxylase [Handroanthus impetiginosus]|uniref:acetyl-CoA carboxytransferase n=1 Tax=Handroanthus impetiginosus TaxID=429701 RepID=A0A2G9I534_9LAMI|nr:Acetyl-CoA carboxylase [Handroanthus impetiginosus]
MASMAQSPMSLTGNLASKSTASDLLRSSTNSFFGVPLRAFGRAQLGAKKRDFTLSVKLRKGKKHERPWPKDPDPNVKGGILGHLSHFKPLKEKPKPVILEFEKPLMDIQKKIVDVQKMANETGLDFGDQIMLLENKYNQALKDLYTHLTPIQRVHIARHPNRPTFLDHVFSMTEKFVELHGDRAGYDDPAIVTGIGTINGRRYMFIGHQKGRNTKENIHRNFGMPTPHGYRKALRMMHYADHHGFPIITFIDTPGAYADLKSEHLGQGEAIAHNLRTMFGLKVPVVSIVIGEGGSGGALAIGCANKLLMLENAVFYVASPEACAAILWKSAKAAAKAARRLRITAKELFKLQICDGVIPEPLGGAHADPYWTSEQIKAAINKSMDELIKMDTETLLNHRAHKFRKLRGYHEGSRPQYEPKRKLRMKKKAVPIVPIRKTSEVKSRDEVEKQKKKETAKVKSRGEVEKLKKQKTPQVKSRDEVEKLKKQILEAGNSSAGPQLTELTMMIEKLKRGIENEYVKAAEALGMKEKILMVQEEITKAMNVKDELEPALREKIEQLNDEFDKNLPTAPNYPSLKYKLDMLNELFSTLNLQRKSTKKDELRTEIFKKIGELVERPDVKQKIETLKAEMANSALSDIGSNSELKEKVLQLNKELDSEFKAVVKPMASQEGPAAKLKDAFDEVTMTIDNVVNSSALKDKIELLKAEVAKAGNTPDEDSKSKIHALETQIKQAIQDAISLPELKGKNEHLAAEILEATKSSAKNTENDQSKLDGSQAKTNLEGNTEDDQSKLNLEANRSFV